MTRDDREPFRVGAYLLWLTFTLIDLAIGSLGVWAGINLVQQGKTTYAAVAFFFAAVMAGRLSRKEDFR